MATKPAKKKKSPHAKITDPKAWLVSKLGPKGAKDFLKGISQAAKDSAAGQEPKVEVEGQVVCSSYCMTRCYPGTPMNNGFWSWWFSNTP